MNGPSFNANGPNNSPDFGPHKFGPAPAQDEKLMAAAAHASILVPHAGLLVPLVLWLMHSNSGRAPFVAAQARQAFFFQLSVVALEWLVIILGGAFGFLTFGLGWFLIAPLVGLGHLAAAILGIIGAVDTFHGRDFRYPIIGSKLAP